MGDIGEKRRIVEIEPVEAPIEQPAPQTVPAQEPVPA